MTAEDYIDYLYDDNEDFFTNIDYTLPESYAYLDAKIPYKGGQKVDWFGSVKTLLAECINQKTPHHKINWILFEVLHKLLFFVFEVRTSHNQLCLQIATQILELHI